MDCLIERVFCRKLKPRKGNVMFNMDDVGMKISELRKAKNMTQIELADRMSISFQAVSNWERGFSMPDISKLPELTELFGVTIDELLGKRSELIDSAASGKIDAYLENNSVTVSELSEAAPVLTPRQVDTIFEKTRVGNLHEIADLLPFISRDTTNQLARKAAESGNYKDLDEIAPFVSRDVIDQIAGKMISEGRSIAEVAPFVSRDVIAELAEISYHKTGRLSALDDIAPFIPGEQLQKIAEEEYANRGLRHFESIAPFLNKGFLNGLAEKAIRKDGIKAISPIAPFLDKNMLSEYVKENYL